MPGVGSYRETKRQGYTVGIGGHWERGDSGLVHNAKRTMLWPPETGNYYREGVVELVERC